MAEFIENARFPTNISKGALGGPQFNTGVIAVSSGYENRNINWNKSRAKYEVSHAVRTEAEYAQLLAFFNMTRGRAYGFRFKDWMDYRVSSSEGRLVDTSETLDGSLNSLQSGHKYYQLAKLYKFGGVLSNFYLRHIRKPVSPIVINRGGTPISIHSSTPDQINSIDYTTGRVTFNPSNTFTFANSTIINGLTTTIYIAGNQTSLLPIGSKLYFESNINIPEFKDTLHTVLSSSHSTFTTVVINTNSNNYSGSSISGGISRYLQSNQELTWSGEYDIPCRFDIDAMEGSLDNHLASSWSNIPLIELRE